MEENKSSPEQKPDASYRMKPLEEEAVDYAAKRAKTKKRIIKAVIWAAVILALILLIAFALERCSNSLTTDSGKSFDPLAEGLNYGEFFYSDIEHDIFKDDNYKDCNREIFIETNGVGSYYSEANISGAPSQAKLFYTYFTSAINGDGAELNKLFTSDYFYNLGQTIKPYPDKFPMQKIYGINVELCRAGSTNTTDGVLFIDIYKVSFYLLENNGAFRPDIPEPENGTAPLYFEILTLNNESQINRIYQQNFVNN